MQTFIPQQIKDTPAGAEADRIIRKCVHCGFCNVTCPSYQVVGNELDGPRGRIYLIKRALEENQVGAALTTHLDRCLTCRNCETTCPAGVEFGKLLDIGREIAEQQGPRRSWRARILRRAVRWLLPHRRRFGLLLWLGQLARPLLPSRLKRSIPVKRRAKPWPEPRHARRVLLLEGCVQPSLDPGIDAATARVLDRLGISVVRTPAAGCCGAISHHLSAFEAAKASMRANIDAWWPAIEAGAEAIVATASGCGVTLKEYGRLLQDDPEYAAKAARIETLAKDLSQILDAEDLSGFSPDITEPVAYQSPCTLQHGQKLPGKVEAILRRLGVLQVPVQDAHLCCGAAGTYSLLQPKISGELGARKIANLQQGNPRMILTANIGCQVHLQARTHLPVRHWIELLDREYR